MRRRRNDVTATAGDLNTSLATGRRMLGLRSVQYGLGFVTSVIITRALGPSGRAMYALPLNFVTAVLVVSHLSVELAVTRLFARREATLRELARVGITVGILLGVAGTAVAAIAGIAFRHELLAGASSLAILLASLTIAPSVGVLVLSGLMLRSGNVLAYGLAQAAQAVLQTAAVAVVWRSDALTPDTTLGILLAITFVPLGVVIAVLRRDLGAGALRPSHDWPLVRRVVVVGLTLHASSIALYLNLRLDLFVVGASLDAHEAGLYSLATTLAELLIVATSTMSLAALPAQTRLDVAQAREYTTRFTRHTLAYAGAFVVAAIVLAKPFISATYGAQWEGAALPAVLLSLGTLALAIEAPARGLLLRVGRPRSVSLAAVAAMGVNAVCLLILVPRYKLVGASVASVASYWTAAVLMVALVRRATSPGPITQGRS